jgi:AcrR family transcriptional regulator
VKNFPQLSNGITEPQPGIPSVPSLRERKVRAVRESIWDIAMDLFADKGYDETTVDDIARAAGISLRSFFRYFLSKGDLMSYALLLYGNQLAAAIDACPADYPVREVFRESISSVAHLGLRREDRTRKHLEILRRSQAAAAAEMSRLPEVQVLVARAYERRLPAGAERALAATAMAGVSLHLTGVAVRWCLERGESELPATMELVLAALEDVFCKGNSVIRS